MCIRDRTNTFNIVLAVFDVSQHVIQQSAGIIQDVYKRQQLYTTRRMVHCVLRRLLAGGR